MFWASWKGDGEGVTEQDDQDGSDNATRNGDMKKSKVETAETRKRIVLAAAQAFRNNGIHATSVAEVMSAAGLTHGGFYRHFASKEHLVAEACAAGMKSTLEAIDTSPKGGEQAFIDYFETHLPDKGSEACLSVCPLIAMGSELARADPETRHTVTHGYRELINTMSANGASDEGAAIFAFSAILGAITVSRIVDDPELSARVLTEAQQRIGTLWAKPRAQEAVVDQGMMESFD